MMSIEERLALKNANSPEIGTIFSGDAYFDWRWNGCGFGQLSFEVDKATQRIMCGNECMRREDVRKILVAFANHIADNCVMEYDREARDAAEAEEGN